MEIENAFAAAVISARGLATLATNAGWPLTASDQIVSALAGLWDDGPRAGLSREDIAAIINRYLVYRSGEPLPRKRARPGACAAARLKRVSEIPTGRGDGVYATCGNRRTSLSSRPTAPRAVAKS
jgi:hypothetical protein